MELEMFKIYIVKFDKDKEYRCKYVGEGERPGWVLVRIQEGRSYSSLIEVRHSNIVRKEEKSDAGSEELG